MTSPSPLTRTRMFCNTALPPPTPCVRTNLLYPLPLLCKIEFFVQNFIRFRDAAYYNPKDYTLFNFFFALLILTTKQCFLNKHYMNLLSLTSFSSGSRPATLESESLSTTKANTHHIFCIYPSQVSHQVKGNKYQMVRLHN